ncbi:MAG: phosphoenolpyruvate carboxylase [Saprospiraceae bacterium]|nr:phosphoenolpyruvate carboxylase [Candidatus Opimibacter iunctus]
MDQTALRKFDRHVGTKYHLFNSLFLRLPFDLIHQTGILLPLLSELCQTSYRNGRSPQEIIEAFFEEYLPGVEENEKTDLLFNFVKYIERQVVLFDAVEEAAFDELHDKDGAGTVYDMVTKAQSNGLTDALLHKLEEYRLRIVLTAHPTQFYPGTVLGIITDLSAAIEDNRIFEVNDLLLQLGKTPFVNRTKPTPLDEAKSLIWFLRKVFYDAVPEIVTKIEHGVGTPLPRKDIIDLGFWPGGDRDGNPNVTGEITLETAAQLRKAILICYQQDVQKLRRRLTFLHVYDQITAIGEKLNLTLLGEKDGYTGSDVLLSELHSIRQILAEKHDNLFAEGLEEFITKVEIFGFHFASLDIRQESRKHEALVEEIILKKAGQQELESYKAKSVLDKMKYLDTCKWAVDTSVTSDPTSVDIIRSFEAIRDIQSTNGIKACHRYVISNSRHGLDVYSIQVLARWIYGHEPDDIDIVPLFESIDDLGHAAEVMQELYTFEPYAAHLQSRDQVQTVMLGFSDGTKDGGYLKANWSIYTCKEELTTTSRANGVKVIFFDGRGGPPARGGGNTHKFYSSLGPSIENREIQLTIQGQTISSNFGSKDQAIYNIEQLLTSGIENDLYPKRTPGLTDAQRGLINDMADAAYQSYVELKSHPDFLTYLQENGTLSYYGESNIGSRPDKRGGGKLTLESLRAIPFVGSWSQLKQNVPGYYGFGAALEQLRSAGRENEVTALYQQSRFFQTLVGNSMQSLAKCYFPLTAFLSNDPEFGEIWNMIHAEFERSLQLLIHTTGEGQLLGNQTIRESIHLREDIVLPLLTIQQYALLQINQLSDSEQDQAMRALYRKLVTRTMPGIINAARNSA